jgi:ABC-type transport system involved in cytochrome bd biosynthesis fused ATPase/permease subunit
MRYIVALAWIYVVLLMSFAEQTAVAGVMTFLLYAVLPWMIILYVMGSPKRRRARKEAEIFRAARIPEEAVQKDDDAAPEK